MDSYEWIFIFSHEEARTIECNQFGNVIGLSKQNDPAQNRLIQMIIGFRFFSSIFLSFSDFFKFFLPRFAISSNLSHTHTYFWALFFILYSIKSQTRTAHTYSHHHGLFRGLYTSHGFALFLLFRFARLSVHYEIRVVTTHHTEKKEEQNKKRRNTMFADDDETMQCMRDELTSTFL